MTLINTIFSVVIWYPNVDNMDTLEINTHLLHRIIECWFLGGVLVLAPSIISIDELDHELSSPVSICIHSNEYVHFLVKWLHRPSQLFWDFGPRMVKTFWDDMFNLIAAIFSHLMVRPQLEVDLAPFVIQT
jgi:hypothetical protein